MLFLLVLALTGCLSEEIPTEKETTLVRVGEEAPHFTVGMLDDTAITLSDLQGNVVLLTFFSTWCPTCRKQMQQMQTQIVDRFADRKFRFLPINRGETQQTVQEFCRELGIAFSVGLDPDERAGKVLFTDHTYDNLGIPSKPGNPFFKVIIGMIGE